MKKTVRVPSVDSPERSQTPTYFRQVHTLELEWKCPECGGERGPVVQGLAYDGSVTLIVDTWQNPCGHTDRYADLVRDGVVLQGSEVK